MPAELMETRRSPLERLTQGIAGLNVFLTLAIVFFVCLIPIAVTDFWWQAKTGEIIVQTGAVPRQDPFSFTAYHQPWLVHEWLTEVFFYAALAHMPHWVLIGYKCGLAALSGALVLVRGWKRSGSVFFAIATTILASFVLRQYADLRPQMISFVLLSGVLLALDAYREGLVHRLPWVLPLVFLLWANLHGGVVVGLVLIALWVAGEGAGQWLYGEKSPGVAKLALALVVSTAAVSINPNGLQIYSYPFQVLGHPQVMDYITEWYAPTLHQPEMRPFFVLLLTLFGVLALVRGRGGVVRFGETLVLVAMAYAALLAQRNTVPFALAAAPTLAAGLAVLWRDAAPLRKLREATDVPALRAASCAILSVTLGCVLWLVVPRVAPDRWYSYGINEEYFPKAAVELMKQGMWPGRLYNDYVWGGYLIWYLYPSRQVFIDGRAEVYYPTRAFDDEMAIHRLGDGWSQALDRRGVDVVLTSRTGGLASALRTEPGWQLAFTGPVEVVYTRTKIGSTPAVKTPGSASR